MEKCNGRDPTSVRSSYGQLRLRIRLRRASASEDAVHWTERARLRSTHFQRGVAQDGPLNMKAVRRPHPKEVGVHRETGRVACSAAAVGRWS